MMNVRYFSPVSPRVLEACEAGKVDARDVVKVGNDLNTQLMNLTQHGLKGWATAHSISAQTAETLASLFREMRRPDGEAVYQSERINLPNGKSNLRVMERPGY